MLEPEAQFIEGWALEAICEHLEAVTFGRINRLLINVPPGFMKSMTTNVFWPAWEWATGKAHLRYVTFSYSSSLTERDNGRFRDLIVSRKYQELWGIKFTPRKIGETKVSNDKMGWKLASSVGGVGTGERGDRVILDDPHNVKEVESDIVRDETVRWFRESMSNRLNNEAGAIVVIMQRLHEADVSGTILTEGFDYVHLMIPMEYDWPRQCSTEIGWEDQRGLDEEGPMVLRDEDGVASPRDKEAEEELNTIRQNELAWPERFGPSRLEALKKELGPYAYCTPAESPVLMGDLSLRPIGKVAVGDEVVGFETGDDVRRARLKPARVLSISKSTQPVVRLTLDSGAVVRCTADHKWFTGRNDASHKPYKAAAVGSPLKRVCPATLPALASEDDLRLAGWVSGFFDGEGSVSVGHRRGAERNSLITFTQSAEKNLPLCLKLERALDHLGFSYGVNKHQPTTLSTAGIPWQRRHYYYLKSDAGIGFQKNGPSRRASRLTLNQRFLHVIQPTKWRDRIIDTTVNGRMYTTTERVVSIDPDGEEEVFGLETTTGNYVVWGLASSNSGQYQQAPVPRGGGIFKDFWWQLWSSDKWPTFDYLVGSVDGAFTEKEENDPSAMTVWGVFKNDTNNLPCAVLVKAWRKHLQIHGTVVERGQDETYRQYRQRAEPQWGLVEWVAETCRFRNSDGQIIGTIDKLLIEGKATGISVAQEIQRLYADEGWMTETCEPKGDKVSRAMAVVPTFANEQVFAPARNWADLVIQEMAIFPKGRYKDLTDSATQAIKHLRDMGMLSNRDEVRNEEDRRGRLRRKPSPLYPV